MRATPAMSATAAGTTSSSAAFGRQLQYSSWAWLKKNCREPS